MADKWYEGDNWDNKEDYFDEEGKIRDLPIGSQTTTVEGDEPERYVGRWPVESVEPEAEGVPTYTNEDLNTRYPEYAPKAKTEETTRTQPSSSDMEDLDKIYSKMAEYTKKYHGNITAEQQLEIDLQEHKYHLNSKVPGLNKTYSQMIDERNKLRLLKDEKALNIILEGIKHERNLEEKRVDHAVSRYEKESDMARSAAVKAVETQKEEKKESEKEDFVYRDKLNGLINAMTTSKTVDDKGRNTPIPITKANYDRLLGQAYSGGFDIVWTKSSDGAEYKLDDDSKEKYILTLEKPKQGYQNEEQTVYFDKSGWKHKESDGKWYTGKPTETSTSKVPEGATTGTYKGVRAYKLNGTFYDMNGNKL